MISHNHYKTVDTLYCESLEKIKELEARNKELILFIENFYVKTDALMTFKSEDHEWEVEKLIKKAKKLLGEG